jgi:hypothetical protein
MGQPLAGLIISPPLRQAHQAGLDRYLATGEGPVLGQHLELTAVRADGSELPVELSITKVALPGRCSPRACATLPAADKSEPNSRPRASGCANPSGCKAWAVGRGRGARLQQPARGHPVLCRLRRAARRP